MPWTDREYQREYNRAYRVAHLEQIRAREREYRQTPVGRNVARAKVRRFKRKATTQLRDSYIYKRLGVRASAQPPAALIEAKRQHLKLRRLLHDKVRRSDVSA